MESKFIPSEHESKIYEFWEKKNLFEARVDKKKKSFSIVLPPPNANGNLHLGHAMYVYEDILVRYNKIKGNEVLWLLGLDHAGIETQYVFEKELRKQGKSRYDFDRDTLFQMIWDFVMKNKGTIKSQVKRLGYALDWSKEKFTMDPKIVDIVYDTFEKLFKQGLIYRGERLVNFCTRDGTSFADLEVVDKEIEGILYYISYPLKDGGSIPVSTTRPETLLGDVAVMVNPDDKRYKNLIGKTVVLPLLHKEIPIIADAYVDKKFGTGAVKVTPAHDQNDFEVGKRHHLSYTSVIDFNGRMQNTGLIDGMKVKEAREEVIKRLKEKNLLIKEEPHKMVIKTCYKCGNVLEPLPLEQWYIEVKPLVKKALLLIKDKKTKIYPKRFNKILTQILNNFIDWNISRQNVWGIRIPAYYCTSTKEWFVSKTKPEKCTCGKQDFVQDTDTFDTWFSSSQWPFATLMTEGEDFYNYFYPLSVMETGYDIARAWVARMMMIGAFVTDKEPFENVLLHGMIRDRQGQKMSKSKGNVIDPLVMIDKYGADALRMALIFGTKEGNDVVLSEEKVLGMRNFGNKIWNIGRFLEMGSVENNENVKEVPLLKDLAKEFKQIEKSVNTSLDSFKLSYAAQELYEFIWHRFADYYIEQLKEEIKNGNIRVLEELKKVYLESLILLHPFMPFVTEAIWQVFKGKDNSILESYNLLQK